MKKPMDSSSFSVKFATCQFTRKSVTVTSTMSSLAERFRKLASMVSPMTKVDVCVVAFPGVNAYGVAEVIRTVQTNESAVPWTLVVVTWKDVPTTTIWSKPGRLDVTSIDTKAFSASRRVGVAVVGTGERRNAGTRNRGRI